MATGVQHGDPEAVHSSGELFLASFDALKANLFETGSGLHSHNPHSDANDTNEAKGHSPNLTLNGAKKKHSRRAKKKKWRPYHTLTWEEKLQRDEIATKKASQKRRDMIAKGHAIAPENTTQYLMEEHDHFNAEEMSASLGRKRTESESKSSGNSSDLAIHSSSSDDEESFMERDFSEMYADAHNERLDNMTKPQLVNEILQLESRLNQIERDKMNLISESNNLKNEFDSLQKENDRLKSSDVVHSPID